MSDPQKSSEIPPLLARAASLFQAISKHVANGMQEATPEEQARRRSICDPCEFRDVSRDVCKACGCALSGMILNKIKMPLEKCPKGFWNKEEV